jgi:hypothetical protein
MARRDAVFPAGPRGLYEINRYSAAIRSGDLLFVSGQAGSREDGSPDPDFERQVCLAFDNLNAVLAAAGCTATPVGSVPHGLSLNDWSGPLDQRPSQDDLARSQAKGQNVPPPIPLLRGHIVVRRPTPRVHQQHANSNAPQVLGREVPRTRAMRVSHSRAARGCGNGRA